MNRRLCAMYFIAACAISTGAIGQKVYRCGTEYSQTPCQNGVTVSAEDPRSPTQKAESDASIRREAAAANAMEKARLADEAKARADGNEQPIARKKKNSTNTKAGRVDPSTGSTNAMTPADKKNHAKKKKEPEFFTARVTPVKTKPSASK